MKTIISIGLLAALGVACGTATPQGQSDNNGSMPVDSSTVPAALQAEETNLPEELLVRIPVVNGNKQFDQVQMLPLASGISATDGAQMAEIFSSRATQSQVLTTDDLDSDSSTQSWYYGGYRHGNRGYGYGYSNRYRHGYGYGYNSHVYYRPYSYGNYYRPYAYNSGYYYGNYYYCNYRRNNSWYY